MLPISIVIPTRNAASAWRGETGLLRKLVAHAADAVVVDSASQDGTWQLLEESLRGLAVRFFQHPPGLYESWNHGIAQAAAPYVYIATAGDTIECEGLGHLLETAQNLRSDVVVSPPKFRNHQGLALDGKQWPIHHLIAQRGLREPVEIDPWEVFVRQVVDAPQALIGSSAANLYRTETLRRFPFPTDHGHFGDVAWGIEHAFETKLAVTPRVVSTFMVHESGGAMEIEGIERARARLLALAQTTLEHQVQKAGPSLPAFCPDLKRLAIETSEAWRLQQESDRLRKGAMPWVLRPKAWSARRARKRQLRSLKDLRAKLVDACAGLTRVGQGGGGQYD